MNRKNKIEVKIVPLSKNCFKLNFDELMEHINHKLKNELYKNISKFIKEITSEESFKKITEREIEAMIKREIGSKVIREYLKKSFDEGFNQALKINKLVKFKTP
ncbi:MAG TPA: hypothetical protein VMZ91_04195 [Candidatus Paceibacterota bacterium]|nr:hypothetical protein [Candidatus Paceibacterota bacterium]